MIDNPLYDHWKCSPPGYLHCEARHEGCMTWAWAIPNDEALTRLTELSPLVEIGAGRGYWASLLKNLGADILAFDRFPPDDSGNEYFGGIAETYCEVYNHDHTIAGEHPDRTLLIVWPCYDEPWAYEATKLYREAGGKCLVFVGEGSYGCCADEDFFEYVYKYSKSSETIHIPTWGGIQDAMTIWEF